MRADGGGPSGRARVWPGGAVRRAAGVREAMRLHGLCTPYHPGRRRGSTAPNGRITTDLPGVAWGTDAPQRLTHEGAATIFIAVDHRTSERIGIHAAGRGTHHEALESLRPCMRLPPRVATSTSLTASRRAPTTARSA